jgi:hypothetical protein
MFKYVLELIKFYIKYQFLNVLIYNYYNSVNYRIINI